MQRLTCIKRVDGDPLPLFIVTATNPLKHYWPACEKKIEHWADLVKGFNRIVGGVFFAQDIARAKGVLESLAAEAEASMRQNHGDKAERMHLLNAIVGARNAAASLEEEFSEALANAETVEDVDCARFHKRQGRN